MEINSATATGPNLQLFGYLPDNAHMAKKKLRGRGRPPTKDVKIDPVRAPTKYHDPVQALNDLIELSGMTNLEIAVKCGFYTDKNEPDGQKISKLRRGNRFNLATVEEIVHDGLGRTLVEYFAASARYPVRGLTQSSAQVEMTSIMDDLPSSNQKMLIDMAREMRKAQLQIEKLKPKK